MKATLWSIAVCASLALLAVAALIAFGTAGAPTPLSAVTNPFAAIDYSTLPSLQKYRARDGTDLHFREYAADSRQVAVLIHGSAGSSSDMHPLALALQRAGVTVYVPDIRGQGANLPHGDIGYLGQLDDDMADFMAKKKTAFPSVAWSLIGFSSGGGFALRIAADRPLGELFDRYILLSPYLKYNGPASRTSASQAMSAKTGAAPVPLHSWAAAFTGRIIGLTVANAFGVHAFDGLPVVAFAVPEHIASVTKTYSWRLQRNFQPHASYQDDIRAVLRPMHVYVGALDQLFIPEKLRSEFQIQRPDIPVFIMASMGHTDMITSSPAIEAVVSEFGPHSATSTAGARDGATRIQQDLAAWAGSSQHSESGSVAKLHAGDD
jgi:non-heme chloroperoxidase